MLEVVHQTLDELRGAWRFRWAALAAAWIVCVVGWATVALWPNTYEASARVYVDANTGLTPLLQGLAVETDVDAQLMLVRQTMLGRPALEKVARETDLHLQASTPRQMERLIFGLQRDIEISNIIEARADRRARPGTEDSLYLIRYKHRDRQKALAVVRELLNNFVENTLGGSRTGAATAQRFLEQQVKDYAKRLTEAESALAEFKKQNLGLVPGQSGDFFTRMQTETAAVKQARADLSVAMNQREELQRQLRGERQSAVVTPAAAAGPNMPTTDTALRLAEAQKRLDELLLGYTDKHPDVIATRDAVRQLEERQEQELQALREGRGPANATLAASPVYQNIQMTLNQVEVQIASLRSRIGQGQSNIDQLTRLASTAPEVEAEYTRLTRDYEVTHAQYNSLLERLEKAKLSDQAEQTGIVTFEVIDPPIAPLEPVAPDRPVLVALVMLIGLGAGGALAYLLHQWRPVFRNARMLTEVTGLPVLGAVAATWAGDRAVQRRRELIACSGAFAALVLAFALVFVWYASDTMWWRGLLG